MDEDLTIQKELEQFKKERGDIIFDSVIEVFITDIPADINELKEAISQENFGDISNAAHKLHGILGMLFLKQSAALIHKIKLHSETKSIRVINALAKVFLLQMEETIVLMKKMLESSNT